MCDNSVYLYYRNRLYCQWGFRSPRLQTVSSCCSPCVIAAFIITYVASSEIWLTRPLIPDVISIFTWPTKLTYLVAWDFIAQDKNSAFIWENWIVGLFSPYTESLNSEVIFIFVAAYSVVFDVIDFYVISRWKHYTNIVMVITK